MTFKAKLSKQGNGYCIYIPRDVRTLLDLNSEYEWSVRTDKVNNDGIVITKEVKEIKNNCGDGHGTDLCPKHPGSMKKTCGCK